ncbi:MAG: succinyl-diaminopimelate desuccinylase [Vicinamibacterales bacterium]
MSSPSDEIHRSTLELARNLIARASLTPADAGCIDVIAERLQRTGFACERIDRGGVSNLWARRGDARPLVCFAGHVDVVPPGPASEWVSDPFAPTERDGYLYGRGTADMKTPLAASITAIERLVRGGDSPPGSIGLIVTSDEEGAATDGTVAVVEWLRARGERIDQCILTEPTSSERLGDTIKNGRRGSLSGRLTVKGVQGHIAYPHLARNPIHLALPALTELMGMEWDRGDASFEPTSFQVSNIHAGTGAGNVIPSVLGADFNFRFAPTSSEASLASGVAAVLEKFGLEYELSWTLSGAPFITRVGRLVDLLARAVREVTGVEPALSTGGGTSDGRFLAAVADEVVEFGPVNESIHKANERISLADLAPLSAIYERALGLLLATST